MNKLLLITLSLAFIGCGKDAMPWSKDKVYIKSTPPAEAEMYSYELSRGACSTGSHSFHTITEVCQALLDEDLNRQCAEEERLELYRTNCEQS